MILIKVQLQVITPQNVKKFKGQVYLHNALYTKGVCGGHSGVPQHCGWHLTGGS